MVVFKNNLGWQIKFANRKYDESVQDFSKFKGTLLEFLYIRSRVFYKCAELYGKNANNYFKMGEFDFCNRDMNIAFSYFRVGKRYEENAVELEETEVKFGNLEKSLN